MSSGEPYQEIYDHLWEAPAAREQLNHYRNAAEHARSELAATLVKFECAQSEVSVMCPPNSELGLSASGGGKQSREATPNRTAGHRLKPTDSLPVRLAPGCGAFLKVMHLLCCSARRRGFPISEKPHSLARPGAPELSGLQLPGFWRAVSFFWTMALQGGLLAGWSPLGGDSKALSRDSSDCGGNSSKRTGVPLPSGLDQVHCGISAHSLVALSLRSLWACL